MDIKGAWSKLMIYFENYENVNIGHFIRKYKKMTPLTQKAFFMENSLKRVTFAYTRRCLA